MKIHSVIANTISEEILQTGHLSIRLLADGFSLLLEDKLYKPVVLINGHSDQLITLSDCLNACEDWLNRHTLLDNFQGECSLLPASLNESLVPEDLFSEDDLLHYLSSSSAVHSSDSLMHKHIINRSFVIVYSIRESIKRFSDRFQGNTRIISEAEALLSVADQVNASDHQRGFALMEVQHKSFRIVLIKNDEVQLINQLEYDDAGSLVYHALNILQQLEFDRSASPLYYAGALPEEAHKTLKRYIKNILPLSYIIQDIDKNAILENILLAEATKCG